MKNETPFELLAAEPETINQAILLADTLMRREAVHVLTVNEINEAEKVLEAGTDEIRTIERHRDTFVKTTPASGSQIPVGF
jgi:hypothetical protein